MNGITWIEIYDLRSVGINVAVSPVKMNFCNSSFINFIKRSPTINKNCFWVAERFVNLTVG